MSCLTAMNILHASGELDGLCEVTLVRYLHYVSPDTLVILGEDRSCVLNLGRAWSWRTRIFRFLLRCWYALFPASIVGRRRFIPTFDGRCRRCDRLTLNRLVQHAHSARRKKQYFSTIF